MQAGLNVAALASRAHALEVLDKCALSLSALGFALGEQRLVVLGNKLGAPSFRQQVQTGPYQDALTLAAAMVHTAAVWMRREAE